jgi:hypothetical protein
VAGRFVTRTKALVTLGAGDHAQLLELTLPSVVDELLAGPEFSTVDTAGSLIVLCRG